MEIHDVSFESKVFNPLLEKIEIDEAEKLAMIEVFNLIVDTHESLIGRNEKKVAKKLYTETHMVSLIPYFAMSVKNDIVSEMMADWLIEFFGTTDGASVSTLYNEASGSGSAKPSNIIDRDDALSESYNEFFKVDEAEEDEEDEAEEVEVESEDEDGQMNFVFDNDKCDIDTSEVDTYNEKYEEWN